MGLGYTCSIYERITLANNSSHPETSKTSDCKTHDKTETSHGTRSRDVFETLSQSWIVLQRGCTQHAERRDVSVGEA